MIGCSCKVCTSADPRDRRRRCGAYVTASDGSAFLIDTPPELRLACCEYGITKVDAIVLTHAHMDHVAGFDDVRRFNTLNGTWVKCDPNEPGANGRTCRCIGKPMTCYAMAETAEQMHRIFPYIGLQGGQNGLFRPQIGFETAERFEIGSVTVERLKVEHGFPACGYLLVDAASSPRQRAADRGSIGRGKDSASTDALAYISDCHVIPDETIERLRGVGTLVLNCLREREHPTHLSLERARAYVDRIRPGRTYLIHMCHDFLHTEWLAKLAGTTIEPAYDGLELSV